MNAVKKIRFGLSFILISPVIAIYFLHPNKKVIDGDVERWITKMKLPDRGAIIGFVYLFTFLREFRNVFYLRVGGLKYLLKIVYPQVGTLMFQNSNIGPGLFIQHGFATIVDAKEIGSNCHINQQVTVGHARTGRPTLGNNVRIGAGAKVLGGITIGDNVNVGANAVVTKDIKDGCTVIGIPARVISRYGVKVANADVHIPYGQLA